MGTISKRSKRTRLINSIRFKIALAVAVVLIASLGVLNFYPVQIVRQQMMRAAESDLKGGAIALSTALGSLAGLRSDEIESAVALFELAQGRRVLVSDSGGIILYDSVKNTSFIGRLMLLPEIMSALEGFDSFSCTFSELLFESRAASPIVRDGTVTGAVMIYKNDVENANMLAQVNTNMLRVTLAVLALCVSMTVFLNLYLGARFGRLLGGIDAVGRGDFDYRIRMNGRDELSGIAERFNELSRKLKKTERVRRQFVSDASHELKTPLACIKLLSDSIEQNPDVSEQDMREFVHDIGEEINRLIRVSEGLLSLTRLDSVPAAASFEKCDLSAGVRACAELLTGACELYGVKIELDVEQNCFVSASENGLYHVVFNLLENAVKYNRPGGNVWASVKTDGEHALFEVRDDGIGIPENELDKIFERFYRVDKTRARETGGTGLGLSIVNEWITGLGGKIEVESKLGSGTCFVVYLPAWKGDAQ